MSTEKAPENEDRSGLYPNADGIIDERERERRAQEILEEQERNENWENPENLDVDWR